MRAKIDRLKEIAGDLAWNVRTSAVEAVGELGELAHIHKRKLKIAGVSAAAGVLVGLVIA